MMPRAMNENWEIKVIEQPWNLTVKIYLFVKGYRTSLAHFVKGNLEMEEVKESAIEPDATMILPIDAWELLKRTMIDNKVREKNEVEAELGATLYHLEDMRKLLKLNTK